MSRYQLHSNRSDMNTSDGRAKEAGTALLMLLKEPSLLAARLAMRRPVGSISILSCDCLGGNNVNQLCQRRITQLADQDWNTRGKMAEQECSAQ